MAQISYELMTAFYAKAREALKADNFEVAQVWQTCEATVNNVHHGKYPAEWLPIVDEILRSFYEKETDPELLATWESALEFVEIAALP